MKKKICFIVLAAILLLTIPGVALAQTYLFKVTKEVVNVFWNEDGSSTIDYLFVFDNDPNASPIDYVDVGVPNSNYDLNSVSGEINGTSITDIQSSQYVKPGIAFGLGSNAIQPAMAGTVHAYIGRVTNVLYQDSNDENYASAVFSPTWFGSEYVQGTTKLTVIFHLPPGVQPEEPRYHKPQSFPGVDEPVAGIDEQGRITYTWSSEDANAHTQYTFGASFPKKYVPADTIAAKPGFFAELMSIVGDMGPTCCCSIGFLLLFVGGPIWGVYSSRKRRLQYLPPKVSIEGHGIKRGLTAVEAAILMEQPMDKVLTMILFSVIKKGAARVTSKEPLTIEVAQTLPADLQTYEIEFLDAFKGAKAEQKNVLQKMVVNLIKSVSEKMKGFSRKETIEYYQSITDKAWKQVETAGTPEVKGKLFDENLEWTMLDKNYDDHTRDVFRQGPVYVPMWWGHYDPSFGHGHAGGSIGKPSVQTSIPSSSGQSSMPSLPGADFAASMVNGVQGFAAGVVGNVAAFTSGVTQKTNPVPVSTSSGRSGGGGGCACACACAGCACACAGGGR